MSKRSNNLENLTRQKEDIELKILKLQMTLKGVDKSISRLQNSEAPTDKSSLE